MNRRKMLHLMSTLAVASLFTIPALPGVAKAQTAPCACCGESCACEDCGCNEDCCGGGEAIANPSNEAPCGCCGDSCTCGSCGCGDCC